MNELYQSPFLPLKILNKLIIIHRKYKDQSINLITGKAGPEKAFWIYDLKLRLLKFTPTQSQASVGYKSPGPGSFPTEGRRKNTQTAGRQTDPRVRARRCNTMLMSPCFSHSSSCGEIEYKKPPKYLSTTSLFENGTEGLSRKHKPGKIWWPFYQLGS